MSKGKEVGGHRQKGNLLFRPAEISFLFACAGLTITGKETSTIGRTRGGYLATESSCDISCCVGSLNSGTTVKECAGHSGLKSQSANISWTIRFEECRPRL